MVPTKCPKKTAKHMQVLSNSNGSPLIMIAIYSNTGEWGGVDILIGRFANYLYSRGIEFCIIEPDGGRSRKELPNARFVNPDQVQLVANRVTHVFVPSVSKLRDPQFPWAPLAHAKVLTWVVHPNDVFRSFFPYSSASMNIFGYRVVKPLRHLFRTHTNLFDALFARLIKEKALIVMDGATRRSLKYFAPALDTEPEMVPIPSPLTDEIAARNQDSGKLSIGYLGRMDVMKWSAIRPFIRYTLAPMAKKRRIALHLVSEGSHLSRLMQLCAEAGIECHCYGYLPNQQAREVIFSRTDLAVAMGTSALDIAGAGHPCVVIDPSLGALARRQKRFRFVHETEDYTLGEFRDFPGYVEGRREFEELTDKNQLHIACLKGREYVQQAHDPVRCFDELFNRIHDSNLQVAELGKHIRSLILSFSHVKAHPLSHVVGIAPGKMH